MTKLDGVIHQRDDLVKARLESTQTGSRVIISPTSGHACGGSTLFSHPHCAASFGDG